jgi:hypothetical protein
MAKLWQDIKYGFGLGLGLFTAQALLVWIAQLLIDVLSHIHAK